MKTEKTVNPILIDIPMPIETPRLLLRPPQPGDGKLAFAAKKESFQELHQFMPWAKELGTEEENEITLREKQAEFIQRKDLMMVGVEKESGNFVMGTGLHRMDWENRIFEIGYWVRTSKAGKGFASEATNALIRYAFNALSATKITIAHAGGNDASARVIEKLGFIPTGIIKDSEILPTGKHADHHFYARYNADSLPPLDVRWGQRKLEF